MGKPWFAPKRYGYGTGAPTTWQGWAVLLGFLGASFLMVFIPGQLLAKDLAALVGICGVVVLMAIFVAIAKAKTAGGWRWRNGEGP
jgi:cell division protein FtsW (lipid II flippase)